MHGLGFTFPREFNVVADCDSSCGLDGGGGGPCTCFLQAGLCCPDDPLEDVIEEIINKEILEELVIAASPPPPGQPQLLRTGRGKQSVNVDDRYRRFLSRLSAHAVPSDDSSPTSSLAAESGSPPPPPVPRRKRDRPVMRGGRPWSLDMPNIDIPPRSLDMPSIDIAHGNPSIPIAHGNPSNSSGNEDGGGGGVRQQGLVSRPRPRNRQVARACSHCENTQTPQWRAGPQGPSTLCNACGIRYNMNKLLPEYRPSTSPSFQSGKHSNRHRRVVKLREKKARTSSSLAPDDGAESRSPAPDGGAESPEPDGGAEFMDVL